MRKFILLMALMLAACNEPGVGPTPQPSPTASATLEDTATWTPEPTVTATDTPTDTLTPSPSATLTQTASATATPSKTWTPSATPTHTATASPSATPTPSRTVGPTETADRLQLAARDYSLTPLWTTENAPPEFSCILTYFDLTPQPGALDIYRRDKGGYYACIERIQNGQIP